MEEKKSVGFTALLVSVAVAVVLIFGVKFAGGNSKAAAAKNEKNPAGDNAETVGSTEDANSPYIAGTYTASATGMGELTVNVTVDGNGVITGLEIDASNETESLGQVAAPKLQEKILELGTVEGVDAISGCTVTSDAIFKAVNDCLSQAVNTSQAGDAAGGAYTAGTYTASATGMGELTVNVTVDGNGVITGLEIDASNETESLGQVAAPKLQEKILELGTVEGVDAISGCTVTSDAIFKAVADCLSQAAN